MTVAQCFVCGAPTRNGKDFTFHVARLWTMEEKTFRLCQICDWAMEHEPGFSKGVGAKIQEALSR